MSMFAFLMLPLFLRVSGAFTSNSSDASFSFSQSTSIGESSLSSSIATASITTFSSSAVTATASASATIGPNYSPEDLDRLWDVVGPVTPPPFTTTRVPELPIPLPSPPPPLYPSWFSPEPKNILPDLKFPEGFIFGVDTAAFQVEGAVKDEGKGPSVWDFITHQPGAVVDNTTADIADLQYFLYKEDTARVAALGVNAHSFSISWARIFPFGAADSPVNQAGLDHYSDLIDYSLQLGVAPVVTLFHWDTPLALQLSYGGFVSGEIVNDFVNYATTVFEAYNGRVKTWYTFNEPAVFCGQVAALNISFPVGVNSSNAAYRCSYNLLKAHAGAVKAFREKNITGEIAFKNDNFVGTAWRANSTEDAEAVERHAAFQIGIFSDPVYKGDWPKILTDTLSEDYLPRFTEEEKNDILGSADFYAIDSYRSQYVSAPEEGIEACVSNPSNPLWPTCNVVKEFDSDAGWAIGISSDPRTEWLQVTPFQLRPYFSELQKRWPTNKMYIAEFGFAEPFEGIREPQELYRITEDVARTNYYMAYLGEVLLAIHEDKLPIAGIFAWAMVDNMEWTSGLSTRFGIQYVNYTSLERHYKRSAFALAHIYEESQVSQDMYNREIYTSKILLLSSMEIATAHAINLNDGPSNLLQPNTSITNWPPSVATTKALYSSTKMAPARNSFPPIGSIERKYSPVDLDKLWRVVGPVVPPPFTTTPVPVVPFPLPTPPPPLYPAWFSPRPRSILPHLKLPEGFIFGIATAAYQVEGAAKDEGKGPSVWDWATHQSGFVIDNTTVIDYSLELNVEPVITLFHWDMPLALQAYYGGIMSGEIIDDFVKSVFGLRSLLAPDHTISLATRRQYSKRTMVESKHVRAHAGAVKVFREMNITGEIAFKNDNYVGTPWRANSTEDAEAVERHAAFQIGLFSDPVYKGDWPAIVMNTLPEDYLPRFTEKEKREILGSADFYAITSYCSQYITAPDEGIEACVSDPSHPAWPACNVVKEFDSRGWAAGISADPNAPWLQATPLQLRGYLAELQRRWPTNKMYLAEFGFAEPFEGVREPQELYRLKEDVARSSKWDTTPSMTVFTIQKIII
ncbi:hypothetical protein VNI00_003560 [Paramarasmius palmivorus]|uniref:Glycoside hydrolase family 1 protein n=1 Tax=Paramarasmius palmivorus TaxID=297713 RepID=A0AAW0DTZ8_9AGAR